MAELLEIPLNLQLREANRHIQAHPGQGVQVLGVPVAHVPAKIPCHHGKPTLH